MVFEREFGYKKPKGIYIAVTIEGDILLRPGETGLWMTLKTCYDTMILNIRLGLIPLGGED